MMSKIFNVNAIVIWNACNIYGIQRREKFFGLTTFASYFYFSMLHFWRYDLRYWYYVTRFFAGGPVGHKLKQILSMDWDINALLNSDGTIVRPESKISPLLLRESKNVDERKWSNAQSLKKTSSLYHSLQTWPKLESDLWDSSGKVFSKHLIFHWMVSNIANTSGQGRIFCHLSL